MRKKRRSVITCFLALLLVVICLSGTTYAENGNGNLIVHITRTGECYHTAGCSYLKSDIEITLKEAYTRGYRPCERCKPPRYSEGTKENDKKVSPNVKSNEDSNNTTRATTTRTNTKKTNTTQTNAKNTDNSSGKHSNLPWIIACGASLVAGYCGHKIMVREKAKNN